MALNSKPAPDHSPRKHKIPSGVAPVALGLSSPGLAGAAASTAATAVAGEGEKAARPICGFSVAVTEHRDPGSSQEEGFVLA